MKGEKGCLLAFFRFFFFTAKSRSAQRDLVRARRFRLHIRWS